MRNLAYYMADLNTEAEENKTKCAQNQGLKHDRDKPPLDLLSTTALVEIAKVLDYGAKKYGRNNWRKGLLWSRVTAAALRHITSWNSGEDSDPETGLSHLSHASACLMFLVEYTKTHPQLDDRYKGLELRRIETQES